MNITDFLLHRIAEDEAVAQEYVAVHGDWKLNDPIGMDEMGCQDCSPVLAINTSRVLAECKAKRFITRRHSFVANTYTVEPDFPDDGEVAFDVCEYTCRECRGTGEVITYPELNPVEHWIVCVHIRSIAMVYADHPDYQEEWSIGGEVLEWRT